MAIGVKIDVRIAIIQLIKQTRHEINLLKLSLFSFQKERWNNWFP